MNKVFKLIKLVKNLRAHFPKGPGFSTFILSTTLSTSPFIVIAERETKALPSLDSKEHLKFACLNNVNAVTSLITTTLYALESAANRYIHILDKINSRLEDCLIAGGWSDDLWDSMIELRSESDTAKREVFFLVGYWETVQKVADSAIEASFGLDAEYLCSTLCERSSASQIKVKELLETIKNKENEYLIAMTDVAKHKEPSK